MRHLLKILDTTTRELLKARLYVVNDTSGEIRRDTLKELNKINVTRSEAGLSLITREEIQSWPGEFDND